VKIPSTISNYLRIILICIIIALLGLAPRPHASAKYLRNAGQAIAHGDLLVASQNLANAAEFFPWRYDLNLTAGRFAFQAGDPEAAIQYLERSGTISHLSNDDLILLGDAYHQSGDPLMAEAIWKHASQLDNSSQAAERLADLYLQRKDYVSAVTLLEDLVSINPSNIKLYYQIGSLYAITDPTKALPFLAQAEEIDAINADRAHVLYEKIRTASLYDDPSYTMLITGRQLANWGEWELASEAFHNAIILRPDYVDAWTFLGEAHYQMDFSRAGIPSNVGLPELEYALQLDPDSTLANTFMALFWERQEDYSRAQIYLERAIRTSSNDPFLYSELGNILAKTGDLPAAQSAYETAIQLTPQDPLFYRLLAEFALQYQIQIREIALPAIRQAINLDPGNATSLDIMAQVMLMLQDYHSAERYAQSSLNADPDFSPAYLHLGTAYLYLGESVLARRWLALAETVDPDSWIATQAKRMLDYYFP
jgi:tetratricopeptide (TPR) repeat protein